MDLDILIEYISFYYRELTEKIELELHYVLNSEKQVITKIISIKKINLVIDENMDIIKFCELKIDHTNCILTNEFYARYTYKIEKPIVYIQTYNIESKFIHKFTNLVSNLQKITIHYPEIGEKFILSYNQTCLTTYGVIDESTIKIFTEGLCCKFARNLNLQIKKQKMYELIVYNQNGDEFRGYHYFTKDEIGKIYDIEGISTEEDFIKLWTNGNYSIKLCDDYSEKLSNYENYLKKHFMNDYIYKKFTDIYVESIVSAYINKYELLQ